MVRLVERTTTSKTVVLVLKRSMEDLFSVGDFVSVVYALQRVRETAKSRGRFRRKSRRRKATSTGVFSMHVGWWKCIAVRFSGTGRCRRGSDVALRETIVVAHIQVRRMRSSVNLVALNSAKEPQ